MNESEARTTLIGLWSKFYQRLFDDRQESDYIPTTTFETSDVAGRIQQAREFIDLIRSLISNS